MKLLNKLVFIFSSVYMVWRLFTLPIDSNIISIIFATIFLIIEVIDYIEFVIVYFNSIIRNRANIYKEEFYENADVDVIIPTINESLNILNRTLKACNDIDYSKKKVHIYVSDDGNRKKVKELVKKYGFNYLSRNNNVNAKAGNLNFVLSKTNSKYILILDADMAPRKDIMTRLLPYITEDKTVGFVQAPQSFINPDIFQYRFNIYKSIPNDQNYFYNVLQNSNNEINAVVMCGTNVIIRRAAIEKVGGFANDVIAEDFATGMLIQDAGYMGKYVNEIVAEGYQEDSVYGFIKQRTRWQRGCIQTGKKYDILKMNGLKINQKLQYLTGINYWLFGIKRILFLFAPALYSLANIYLIKCNLLIFLIMWMPQYILRRFALDINYFNMSSNTWNKIYQTIFAPIFSVTAIMELIGISKNKFDVSAKNFKMGNEKSDKYLIILFVSHFIMFVINFMAYIHGLTNVWSNVFEVMTIFWSVSNMIYLFIALIFDCSNKNRNVNDYKRRNSYEKLAIFEIFKRLFEKEKYE